MMNGVRFTTPQTNTHPVFTNNMMAPISAAPQIQSNLNPNAPDFTSRSGTFVPSTFPPRSQLAAFQNGAPTVTPSLGSGYGGISQFPGGLDLHTESLIGLMPPRNQPPLAVVPASVGGNAAFRNNAGPQENSSPVHSPHNSNPASPTQTAAANNAGLAQMHEEQRHAKLQPIGTERAQKRSERGGVGILSGGMNSELMWSMQLPEMLSAPPLDHNLPPANAYYSDLDITQYPQLWNWGGDVNHHQM